MAPVELVGDEKQKMDKLREACGEEVDAQLKRGGEEGLTDKTLRRWLVARKWDLEAATKDLRAHAAWREENVPGGRIPDEEVQDNLKEQKSALQGFDVDGRPVGMVRAFRHIPKSFESIKRYICYCLDTYIMLGMRHNDTWDGKLVGVLDLTGMTMANYDFTGLRAIFDTLQNHYPERLHSFHLYNAPVIFYGLWKLVAPFVDPVTRKKVCFVYPKELPKLHEVVPKEILPSELGGTSQWCYVEDALKIMLDGKADEVFPLPSAKTNGAVVAAP